VSISSRKRFYFTSTLKRLFGFTFFAGALCAQRSLAGEAEIRQRLDRLDTLGSVMMIAAHPDDENTALLAYFSRGRHMRTAYLSLTRGEGGQNLIGSEQGAALGVIRTQELFAARKIDGAEQYFTRAIDFGFSKTADETFAHWPREKVLGDIVWNIRRFRPDVIILRFSGTPRDGHGQHQVSAILGREAFSVAADPSKYPEQLQWDGQSQQYVQPWQAKRLMYNVIAFTADQEREADKMADRIVIDVGEYNPELGVSYAEIAGMSRSEHRSQGMGAPEQKGSQKQYLVTIAGDKATKDVFDGIDTTWARVRGYPAVGERIAEARKSLVAAHPEQLLKTLVDVRLSISPPLDPNASGSVDRRPDPIVRAKLQELDETIANCAGLWLDAASDRFQVAPGGNLKISATALLRGPAQAGLIGLGLTGMDDIVPPAAAAAVLVENQPVRYTIPIHVPDSQQYSQPYWLVKPPDGWLYTVPDPKRIGFPENPPVLAAHFRMKIEGAEIELERPVEYRFIDHLYGERTRPLAIVPAVGIDLSQTALVFPNTTSRRVEVPVRANISKTTGDLKLEAPDGWRVEPASRHFELSSAGEQSLAVFDVTPPSTDAQTQLRATAMVGDKQISVGTQVISYPHIPTQTLFPSSETKLVRADIRTLAHNIGYVMGAGDEEPDAIRQMGIAVTMLGADALTTGDLSRFDAIVTGVRAFNVRADLRANAQRLFDYANNGGALIVQYNVLEGGPFGGDPSLLEHIGPYPITTSRDRVVDENAPVKFDPQNPLLRAPNKITDKDFEGWVQERGLNFASAWDPKYESVLESHDPGEEAHPGGELYARYGKGVYIFTAYSWFRELPAGVPGAYRLFANMMSAAKVQ
jgi:LmbE family N-acetylglucosaminyl deacetylase